MKNDLKKIDKHTFLDVQIKNISVLLGSILSLFAMSIGIVAYIFKVIPLVFIFIRNHVEIFVRKVKVFNCAIMDKIINRTNTVKKWVYKKGRRWLERRFQRV